MRQVRDSGRSVPQLVRSLEMSHQTLANWVARVKKGQLLLASGSEVALCIAAYEQLKLEGVKARVVSMPSWDLFERQDERYYEQVLPEAVQARVSVEAGSALGWDRYVGRHGEIIAMRNFGLSAPGKVVAAHFGFDVAHVVAAARRQLGRHGKGVPV